jgi:hypothetical protein
MPYDFAYRNRHAEIPGEVAGYELAPLSDKGLWSIVSPSGTVTNLNTLGLQVLAYTGAGMPPVENIATPLGVLGGSYLQRTVTRPRTIILSCIAQGLTFAQVQRIKNLIIAQVAPYNSLQTSKALKLHYQLVNYCGDAIGTALEVAVTYAGDLTGNTTNLYQDRFDLQFVEFAPRHQGTDHRPAVKGMDGNMYVGGSFTTANSVACNYIAMWNGTTFVPLGTGMNTNVNALGVLPDGRIVAAGDFTTAGGVACAHIAVWNGTQWQPLGNGLNGPVYSISVNSKTGEIYAIGTFTASGTLNLTTKFAKWNGSTWLPQDADTTIVTGQYYSTALRSSDSEVAIISSFSGATTLNNGTLNTLNYAGTADVFPQIKFTGPGTLWGITNYQTGKSIYFNNYTMLAGETVLYNHDPAGGITFVSSYFGNVLGRILPGSDITSFSLIPGTNYIVPYVSGGTGATKVELIYQNTHFSFEAGAPA